MTRILQNADTSSLTSDERFMAAALALGRRGLGRASPNPSVGALVVRDGRVVGRGCTGADGRPHGETLALVEAGAAAQGATIYVTLEPCSHHGQTPPCCEAIVEAGISRLVYGIDDPNPAVAGRGAAYCRDHGLEVRAGVSAAAAEQDHRGHIRRMTRRRPAVTLKLAETADGYVAGGRHDPRLSITGVAANGAVHVMRSMHDAIMVGVGTILADDPLMTVRLSGLISKPIRIVLDPEARTPVTSRLIQTAHEAPVLILVGGDAPTGRVEALGGVSNVEVQTAPSMPDGRLDLAVVLTDLSGRGVTRIFSEGGPTIAAALIRDHLVDDLLLFTASRPLGTDGVPGFDAQGRAALADPKRFRLVETRAIGTDTMRHFESLV